MAKRFLVAYLSYKISLRYFCLNFKGGGIIGKIKPPQKVGVNFIILIIRL
jgi:hypothetical protein